MKQTITLLFLSFFLFCSSHISAQTSGSVEIIKSEVDTLFDYTSWPNKGHLGVMPIQLQPWLGNGLLNYGIGTDLEFALPKWATFRAVASINLYEGERSVWKEKVYENVENNRNGYWIEAGVDFNFYDFKNSTSSTEIDSNGRYIYTDAIERSYSNGVSTDKSITITQPLYGNYYTFSSFVYRPALKGGFVKYQSTFVDKTTPNPFVANFSVNMFYGGVSFSKIGLGRAFYLSGYADLLFKSGVKLPAEAKVYESLSEEGLIGYRAGCRMSSDWLGGLVEFGMAPGIEKLNPYIKLGLVINYHLMAPRMTKYVKVFQRDIDAQME